MKYLSVCSGIEAASVAWPGWEAVGFSEIEKFPSAVLAHHYPGVPNLGDMTKYKEWDLDSIDLLVGGTPCQSFSVAGLRKGLEDPRGNLMLVYCGILDWFKPRWFVWENVPGVLSSNGGRDFGAFLGAVAELGYGWAYRVLDAQYFGVAQRRRRVFVVGCFGDWASAAQVLFERESLSGNPAPRREAGKEVAGTFTARARSGGWGQDPNLAAGGYMRAVAGSLEASIGRSRGAGTSLAAICPTLRAGGNRTGGDRPPGTDVDTADSLIAMCLNAGGMNRLDAESETLLPISIHPHCIGRAPEAGPQGKEYLTDGSAYCMDGRGQPQAVAMPINIYGGNKRTDRPDGGFYVRMNEETSKTLDAASGLNPTCSQGGTAVMQAVGFNARQDPDCWQDRTGPLDTNGSTRGVAVAFAQNQRDEVRLMDVAGALAAEPGAKQQTYLATQGVAVAIDTYNQTEQDTAHTIRSGAGMEGVPATYTAMQVRRLTPVECERLQGFPDGYTNIPWRGKPESPDGPRYKALGNSMAVPVMRWIGERIQMVQQ